MTDLKRWIAPDAQSFAAVIGPIDVDQIARNELLPYHPRDVGDAICRFQLRSNNSNADPRAVTFVPDDQDKRNWAPEFLKIFRLLSFKVAIHPQFGEYLLDDEIGQKAQDGMGNNQRWKAVKWAIIKARLDIKKEEVSEFHEGIWWETAGGDKAFSSYGWKPY